MESTDGSSRKFGLGQESDILLKRRASVSDSSREDVVIEESEWSAVHTLRLQGHGKKAIARALNLDVKTVRKWLDRPWTRATRKPRELLIGPYENVVRQRAPEVGFNGVVLLRELHELGFGGSYVTLARYLKRLRPSAPAFEPTVRFETPPGFQSQVDWGEVGMWIGDQARRIHIFTMVLGHSRRIFARAYDNERLDSLLDGHQRAFEHFDGRTQRILYDNPRTIVKHKDETGGVVWNAGFKDRMDFYGVTISLCRYYRPQTKGKVERGVAYVKGNALIGRRFVSLDALNEYLLCWCLEVADQRIHGTTGEVPAVRFERDERSQMISVAERPPAAFARSEVRCVNREAVVAVETNRYPVPYAWVGRKVPVCIGAETINIQAPQALVSVPAGVPGGVPASVPHAVAESTAPLCGGLCYRRRTGRYEVASWNEVSNAPRSLDRTLDGPSHAVAHAATRPFGAPVAPHYDLDYLQTIGVVSERSLAAYEQLVTAYAVAGAGNGGEMAP